MTWLSLLFCTRSCPKKQHDKKFEIFQKMGSFSGWGVIHNTEKYSVNWEKYINFINKYCHKPPSPPFWRSSSWNQECKCKMNKNNGRKTSSIRNLSEISFKQKFYTMGDLLTAWRECPASSANSRAVQMRTERSKKSYYFSLLNSQRRT